MTDVEPMSSHAPSVREYAAVLAVLMLLLGLTVGAAFVDLDRMLPGGKGWSLSVALGIAAAKGLLIVMYFMHVKSGPKRAAVFAGAGFVWLAILLTLTMADYLTRNHPPGMSPKGEPRYIEGRGK
jgi:cytochrome c oxidase subunit 4